MFVFISNKAKTANFFTVLLLILLFLTGGVGGYAQSFSSIASVPRLVTSSPQHWAPLLRGVVFNPEDPLKLEFIVDKADAGSLDQAVVGELVSYFLAGLTLPDNDFWVNLSPYEKQRICPNSLAVTALGENMLNQDYLLKQIAAGLTHPDTPQGRDYWYSAKGANSLAKVWIVPESADITEGSVSAYITDAKLNVLCDDSYESFKKHILPLVKKDVNEGKNFAQIRQAYYSLVLAVWFKQKFKDSFYRAYIDKSKTLGIEIDDKQVREKVYAQYVEAFKRGAYAITQKRKTGNAIVTRSYFSGGADLSGIKKITTITPRRLQDRLPARGTLSRVAGKARVVKGRGQITPNDGSIPASRLGFGFVVGGRQEAATRELSSKLKNAGVIDKEKNEMLTRAVLRVKSGTLSKAAAIFADYNDPDVVMEDILKRKEFDVSGLVSGINREVGLYAAIVDEGGERLFTDHEINELVYGHLVPVTIVKQLLADGLPKRNVSLFCRKGIDLIKEWRLRKPLFDILLKHNIIPTQAALLALQKSMTDVIKILQDEYQFDAGTIDSIIMSLGSAALEVVDTKAPGARAPMLSPATSVLDSRRNGVKRIRGKNAVSALGVRERLRGDLAQIEGLSSAKADMLLDTFLRVRESSLRRFKSLFDGYTVAGREVAIDAICGYKYFDIIPIAKNILAEESRCVAKVTSAGKRFFTDLDIQHFLFERLVPLGSVEKLIDDGLTKTMALCMVVNHDDFEGEWLKRRDIFKFILAHMSATEASTLAVKNSVKTLTARAVEYGYTQAIKEEKNISYDDGVVVPGSFNQVEPARSGHQLPRSASNCCRSFRASLVDRLKMSDLSREQQEFLSGYLSRAGEDNLKDSFDALEVYPDNALAANAIATHRHIPLSPLISALRKEEDRYKYFTDEAGARLFSDADIANMLYGHLAPAVLVSRMLGQEVPLWMIKRYAGAAVGVIEFWRIHQEGYVRLRKCGIVPSDALNVALAWKNPQEKVVAIDYAINRLSVLLPEFDCDSLFGIFSVGKIPLLKKFLKDKMHVGESDIKEVLKYLGQYEDEYDDIATGTAMYDKFLILQGFADTSRDIYSQEAVAFKEGVGFLVGNIDIREAKCIEVLSQKFERLGEKRAGYLAKALVLARRETLEAYLGYIYEDDNHHEISGAILANDFEALRGVDLNGLVRAVLVEEREYVSLRNDNGELVFTEKMVDFLLYGRLIRFDVANYFVDQGFVPNYITNIFAKWSSDTDGYIESLSQTVAKLRNAGIGKDVRGYLLMRWRNNHSAYLGALEQSAKQLSQLLNVESDALLVLMMTKSVERIQIILEEDYKLSHDDAFQALRPLREYDDAYGAMPDVCFRPDSNGASFLSQLNGGPVLDSYRKSLLYAFDSVPITEVSRQALIHTFMYASGGFLTLSLSEMQIPITQHNIDRIIHYEPFDIVSVGESFVHEEKKYLDLVGSDGQKAFTQDDVDYLLFTKLVPFNIAKQMADSGIGASTIRYISRQRSDIAIFWEKNHKIFNELVGLGLSPHHAICLAVGSKDPKARHQVIVSVAANLEELVNRYGLTSKATVKDSLITGSSARIVKMVVDTYKVSLSEAQDALKPLADYETAIRSKSDRPKETSYSTGEDIQDGGVRFRTKDFKINTERYTSAKVDKNIKADITPVQGMSFVIEQIEPITNQQAIEQLK